jgi:hypothetical protein
MIIALMLLGHAAMHAQIREWRLTDRTLHTRTTLALQRYYMFARADSLRLRYLRNNAARNSYRLRARLGTNDSLGQLVSLSFGQITIFPASNIRIALGDDLYLALADSRVTGGADERTIVDGDNFGHDDWENERWAIVSLDRIDVRGGKQFGGFVAVGAPESNLSWWSDGTWRVGVATPGWEFAALLPLASGATPVGPLRSRLLAPGYGAAAMARISAFTGQITGRVRFTSVGDPAFESTLIAPDYFVHTLSSQVTYSDFVESTLGIFRADIGAGYEEFAQVAAGDTGDVQTLGYLRRLSPLVDLTWTSAQQNLQAKIGYADLSPRFSIAARLTEHLWFEARLTAPGLFRETKRFEHPFYLFLTPRIKF